MSLSLYVFRIFLFFNRIKIFFFWVFLEVNMAIFIWILYKFNSFNIEGYENFYNIIYYFFIQRLGSIIFFLCCRGIFENLISFVDWIICLSLVIKIGIFPFHFWVFKFGQVRGLFHLFLLLTIQKLPLFFLTKNFYCQFFVEFLFVRLVIGSFFIFIAKNFKELCISSSIYSRIWFYVFLLYSNIMFLFNYGFYSLFMILSRLYYNNISILKSNKLVISILFFFLAGFPPFSLFFCKFYSMSYLFNLSSIFFFSLWIFSFMSLVFYFLFFYKNCLNINYLYDFYDKFKKRYLLIFLFSIYIFIFWVKLSYKLLSSYLKYLSQ